MLTQRIGAFSYLLSFSFIPPFLPPSLPHLDPRPRPIQRLHPFQPLNHPLFDRREQGREGGRVGGQDTGTGGAGVAGLVAFEAPVVLAVAPSTVEEKREWEEAIFTINFMSILLIPFSLGLLFYRRRAS